MKINNLTNSVPYTNVGITNVKEFNFFLSLITHKYIK